MAPQILLRPKNTTASSQPVQLWQLCFGFWVFVRGNFLQCEITTNAECCSNLLKNTVRKANRKRRHGKPLGKCYFAPR